MEIAEKKRQLLLKHILQFKQEITRQEYENLSEDEKRLYTRQNVKDKNKYLFDTAKMWGKMIDIPIQFQYNNYNKGEQPQKWRAVSL